MKSTASKKDSRETVRSNISDVCAVLIGLLVFVLPRNAVWISVILAFALILSAYSVWHCWGFRSSWIRRLGFGVLHVGIVTALGWYVWPSLTVQPKHARFASDEEQKIDFTVSNQTDEDQYQVAIPIDVGGQPESNFDLTLWPSADDARPFAEVPENGIKYLYCLKKASGRPNLIAEIAHLEPQELQHFTITHKAGPGIEIEPKPQISRSSLKAYDKQLNSDGSGRESFYFQIPAGFDSCRVVLGARERTK